MSDYANIYSREEDNDYGTHITLTDADATVRDAGMKALQFGQDGYLVSATDMGDLVPANMPHVPGHTTGRDIVNAVGPDAVANIKQFFADTAAAGLIPAFGAYSNGQLFDVFAGPNLTQFSFQISREAKKLGLMDGERRKITLRDVYAVPGHRYTLEQIRASLLACGYQLSDDTPEAKISGPRDAMIDLRSSVSLGVFLADLDD